MDLILWRHAEAQPGEPDSERRLTAKGVKQAARMAKWLDQHLPETCRILVSPAARAQQTAMALERKFRTVDALAPESDVEQLLLATKWPKARQTVLVVGHQPTLGLAAARLVAGEASEWWMKKGGIWWLSHTKAQEHALVRAVIAADLV